MTSGRRLVLATRNSHKVREFAQILVDFELVALPDQVELPPETGVTFAENARTKALAARTATGLDAIADDSGIAAAALDGAPGVYSARYAGQDATDEENLSKLIAALAGSDDRRVAYVAAVAFCGTDGTEFTVEGRCEGVLIDERRGSGGFGYDPAFVPADNEPGDERTMAELSDAEKHRISHRGRAARALAQELGGLQP